MKGKITKKTEKRLGKRAVSCLLATLLVLTSLPLTVIAGEQIDYSDLTPNQYLAMIFTNHNYTGALNEYGSKSDYPPYTLMEDFYLDANKASKARVVFNEFNAATDYKTTRALYDILTFNGSDTVKDIIELEDYYTAILLSILDTQLSEDNFFDDLNCHANKTFLSLSTNVAKFLESTSKFENMDFLSIPVDDLSNEDIQSILTICAENADSAELWKLVGKDIKVFKTILSAGDTVSEAVKNIADFTQLANLNAAVEEVLRQIYLNCPEDNVPMKNAAQKIYAYASEKISYEILAMSNAGHAAFKYALSEIAGDIWKSFLTAVCGELAAGVFIGQAVGKIIVNYCFATDAVDEQLCAISAMVDFEDVMIAAVRALECKYKSNDNIENSDNYVAALHLLMSVYDLGCAYVEDFVTTVYTKGCINNTIYNDSEEYNYWLQLFENQKVINEKRRAYLYLETYKEVYKIDAPFAYEAYFGNTEATGAVPITAMEVTQKKDLAVGDKGAAYDYFDIKYLPENHTELVIGETVASSDESIIRVDNSAYIGGYIEAVGEGTCTLTFTTYDLQHSASVEVTVGQGNGQVFADDFKYYILGTTKTCQIVLYTGSASNLLIPSVLDGYTVRSIGSYVFEDCTSLKHVIIPNSVTCIGREAFENCTSLTSIIIPNSVTSIENGAFENCTSLTSITIPNSVTSIGWYAFRSCTSLTSITIPDSVTSIGNGAFENCTLLTSITIPNSMTEIGAGVFLGCNSLTSITIPDSVTSIGGNAFSNCTSLASITVPDSVTSIGWYAFEGCGSLASIAIPNGVTEIGAGVFSGCNSLASITIPDSVTSIGNYAFSNCTSLTSVTIPDGVTSICKGAFSGCTALTSITIPHSVTSIAQDAFYRSGLTTIYGYAGSYAETFASENGYTFVVLNDPGDVNGDGMLNLTDYALIVNATVGAIELTETEMKVGDLNGDSAVDAFDASLLNLRLSGYLS